MRWFCCAALLLAAMACLPGCLITSGSNETRTGNYVPPDVFSSIEVGKTTQAWVRTTLGEPSSQSVVDGDPVWKYSYTEQKDSSGKIFLIFGGSSSSTTEYHAFFQFENGVVVKKWRG